MTPTLTGRLQTRLALAVAPAVPVAALAAAMLDRLTWGDALVGLLVISGLGIGWDLTYQAIQDRRWDRDWPRLFTPLTWAPEAFGSWLALQLIDRAAPLATHLVFFTALWVAALVVRSAVLPVVLPGWRHDGQRLVGVRAKAAAPTTEPSTAADVPVSRRFDLGALGLDPGTGRLATLALFFGIVGAVVLLAPLLDNQHAGPMSAGARTSDGDQGEGATAGADDTKATARHGATTAGWDVSRRVLPEAIAFRAAGIDAKLTMTLMETDGVLITPDEKHAAWYGQGAAPGQRGPAVMIGSLDAVFAGLPEAKRGQHLQVLRADDSQVTFEVDRVTTVDARSFPTQQVYGATPKPLLRLVGYDEASGRNTIVFAHAVSVRTTPAEG